MVASTTSLNAKNFAEFVKEGKAVVDFWAAWCGPCKIMAPIFEEAAKELKGSIKFGKIDVEENQEIAYRFHVMGIPTLIFFNNGESVDRISGVVDKKEIKKRALEM